MDGSRQLAISMATKPAGAGADRQYDYLIKLLLIGDSGMLIACTMQGLGAPSFVGVPNPRRHRIMRCGLFLSPMTYLSALRDWQVLASQRS